MLFLRALSYRYRTAFHVFVRCGVRTMVKVRQNYQGLDARIWYSNNDMT